MRIYILIIIKLLHRPFHLTLRTTPFIGHMPPHHFVGGFSSVHNRHSGADLRTGTSWSSSWPRSSSWPTPSSWACCGGCCSTVRSSCCSGCRKKQDCLIGGRQIIWSNQKNGHGTEIWTNILEGRPGSIKQSWELVPNGQIYLLISFVWRSNWMQMRESKLMWCESANHSFWLSTVNVTRR